MISSGRLQSANQLQSLGAIPEREPLQGLVYDVILNEEHPIIRDNPELIGYVGGIRFRPLIDISTDDQRLTVALPADRNEKNLPTKNEIVEIHHFGGALYYKRIGTDLSLNKTADIDTISRIFSPARTAKGAANTYSNVSQTGISRTQQKPDKEYAKLGDYYKEESNIHRLRLYEGDHLTETRFGQSLRFSAYNNAGAEFSPTIILRNKESELSRQQPLETMVEEDMVRDGSIIALLSNEYELGFTPGSVGEDGGSDFETRPQSFRNYPSRLTGDQLYMSSGRIILSAKEAEMIFYSKRNYGFISDGGLSIDNRLGIDISVGDNINVKTNDRNVNFDIGNGSINLGSGGGLEPLVKGDTLQTLLGELIDLINQQTFLTPTGPTSVGPTNRPALQNLKVRLREMLSRQNNTI